MGPTLQAGDWILVRKCEPGWTLAWMFGNTYDNDYTHQHQQQQQLEDPNEDGYNGISKTTPTESTENGHLKALPKRESLADGPPSPSNKLRFLSPLEVALLKSKVQHYERMMARVNHMSGGQPASASSSSFAWFYHSTPVVIPGQVVVIHSPEHFSQSHIKRIVAVGGQWLQQPAHPSLLSMETKSSSSLHHYGTEGRARQQIQQQQQHPSWSTTHRRRPGSRLQLLPPYTLYVEGDHARVSRDSRQYGPLSRNLLVGTAEAIVWPPRRWQRLGVAATPTVQGRPRAFWQ